MTQLRKNYEDVGNKQEKDKNSLCFFQNIILIIQMLRDLTDWYGSITFYFAITV